MTKMLRVLAMCTLLVLGVESLTSKLRKVKVAEELFDNHLVFKEYPKVDSDLAYLLMVASVYYPALEVAQSVQPDKLDVMGVYSKYVTTLLNKVVESPNKAVRELKDTIAANAVALRPLTTVVDEQCMKLTDDQCDALLYKLLLTGNYPSLEKAASVLEKSYKATTVFLSKHPELEKHAENLSYMPFLLSNPYAEFHILVVADWLKAVLPSI